MLKNILQNKTTLFVCFYLVQKPSKCMNTELNFFIYMFCPVQGLSKFINNVMIELQPSQLYSSRRYLHQGRWNCRWAAGTTLPARRFHPNQLLLPFFRSTAFRRPPAPSTFKPLLRSPPSPTPVTPTPTPVTPTSPSPLPSSSHRFTAHSPFPLFS